MGCFLEKGRQAQERQLQEIQRLYQVQLLFEERPDAPSAQQVYEALRGAFGRVDLVDGDPSLLCFAIPAYTVPDGKGGQLPVKLLQQQAHPFRQESVDAQARGQFWNLPDGEAVLAGCQYEVTFFDMMAAGLDHQRRGELLMDGMDAVLPLYPTCKAVFMKPAGKLLTLPQILQEPVSREDRYIWRGVNARFFRIEGTQSFVVDTLGLSVLGLPELQYKFQGLDPNWVVGHAYDVAAYLYHQDTPIQEGETVDGLDAQGRLDPQVQWLCHRGQALIGPAREVVDIQPGEHAAQEF